MPEIPDVVTLTTISKDWGNAIRSRTVQRYSSVSNRTTEHPSPGEGDLSYLEDSNTVWFYDGAAWQRIYPPDLSTVEVDGSTEVAGGSALTTSWAVYATVNLTIPTTWAGWKCEAYATCMLSINTGSTASIKLTIDGTDQLSQTLTSSGHDSAAIGGRRTGMTTTGSRAITLSALKADAGHTASIQYRYLYARAVRTS